MTIIEINDRLNSTGIEVPEGDYQTIAGLVLHELGEIPVENDSVKTGTLEVTVTDMVGARIDRVRLRLVESPLKDASG
jgi:putative hemolysin